MCSRSQNLNKTVSQSQTLQISVDISDRLGTQQLTGACTSTSGHLHRSWQNGQVGCWKIGSRLPDARRSIRWQNCLEKPNKILTLHLVYILIEDPTLQLHVASALVQGAADISLRRLQHIYVIIGMIDVLQSDVQRGMLLYLYHCDDCIWARWRMLSCYYIWNETWNVSTSLAYFHICSDIFILGAFKRQPVA